MGVCRSTQVVPIPLTETRPVNTTIQDNQFEQLQRMIISTIQEEVTKSFVSPASLTLVKKAVSDAMQESSIQEPRTTKGPSPPDIAKKIHRRAQVKIAANLKQTRIDPAFTQQRDAVVENKQLRSYVQQWSKVNSMDDLCAKIKATGKNNLEHAWLLFCWIGENIRFKHYCNNNAAESVFRTREGVCRGYVSLYHECCSLLNISCSEISGYAKQAFLKPGEELKNSPHAWNAIVLNEYTYLLDSTWGAGGGDGENKLEDFYFLTSPEQLIYTHYSNGFQLLEPELTKQEFLSLPIMKSTYYRLKMNLLSPKQGFNETNETIFKISIQKPDHVDLMATLKVDNTEYPRNLHTFCQRDVTQRDVYHCYVAPPLDGLYEVAIFAKSKTENTYRDAVYMRLNVLNIVQAVTFPTVYQPFQQHNCILIAPLQRLVHADKHVLIHMIIPDANVVKIQIGGDYIVPNKDEFKSGVLKKEVLVQGDIHVCARWDDKADSILTICVFNMMNNM